MLTKKHALFLGISDSENKVLHSIQKRPRSILDISEKTAIPRATVYLIIQRLFPRGFIRVNMVGKRYVYKSIDTHKLSHLLHTMAEDL